jgi:hypothetical protein
MQAQALTYETSSTAPNKFSDELKRLRIALLDAADNQSRRSVIHLIDPRILP